ncbi:hypothetical protein [Geobacillus sp. FSL K6-3411]|uniref:hypothetical protein n=1 Tax=Geobacillus sp. FSL K6-3411 TaxID=2954614 RepID=UPI0030DB036E
MKKVGLFSVLCVVIFAVMWFGNGKESRNPSPPKNDSVQAMTVQEESVSEREKQEKEKFVLEKSEFGSVEEWLNHTNKSLHSNDYEPFSSRESFMIHMAYSSYTYARHFYYLEDEIWMKMKLSELIKLFGKMRNESDSSKYDEYIKQFDAIYNEIQKEQRL